MPEEELTKPKKCPHGVSLSFICNDCANPYQEDERVLEDIRARFRFKDEI